MSKPKRVNKSKDQLIAEQERKKEILRKRNMIVNEFYPSLVKATVSIEEAKMLISAMGTLLMEEVLKTMKERKFDEIKDQLISKLCPNGERLEEVTNLLTVLTNENLYVSREIIEGMTRAIQTMIQEEMMERKLDTLKPNWEKYLN